MIPKYLSLLLQAEPVVSSAADPENGILGLGHFSVMEQFLISIICIVLVAGFGSLLKLSFSLMQIQKLRLLEKLHPELIAQANIELPELKESWWKRMMDKWTDYVPVEQEADILLNHNYDGVMELDNNLPPWWKAVFYVSIAIAPVYLYFNHFSEFATSSTEQYAQEMAEAEVSIKTYLATQADLVDETTVTFLEDDNALASGASIYALKCVACHGKLGEGGIGPNLTDDYWLHGGDIADIFKTIKYGVPDMGMIPWKKELRPAAMQEVASYIKSLRGTNPPGAKESQGELYTDSNTK